MGRKDAIAWVLSVCIGVLRRSQAKTLGALVAGAMAVERVSLASIGRAMLGEAQPKHQIKRVYRFIANDRVEPTTAMEGVVHKLLRKWPEGRPLLVSFDWTDIRQMQTLMAAAVVGGRSIPLCWASVRKNSFDKSRNAFEQSLLMTLRSMILRHIRVIILGDRGFGRTELGRFCQQVGFSYVIRIKPQVWVQVGDTRCRLEQVPVHKGVCKLFKGVLYRQRDPVCQNVVIRWKKGLPEKRDGCWYLMTDLDKRPAAISDLYARRMSVEEFFRDAKSKRNGWSLRDTGIQRPERLDRLILVLAITYLLLVGLGLVATEKCRPSMWASNTRKNDLSAFQIGRVVLDKLRLKPTALVAALVEALQSQTSKWG